ncbi:hypothetical protein FRB98_001938, partial [Tulasnella sp. 332]
MSGIALGRKNEVTPPIVTLAVIGAAAQPTQNNADKQAYTSYAQTNPGLCRVVAVAEPRLKTRDIFARSHDIAADKVFTDYKVLLTYSKGLLQKEGKRIADA